jgi:hypothetical protein
MASKTYPLAMPPDLLKQARETAEQTGLSLADTMRQSMKLGLPKLREQLAPQPGLKPFTRKEARQAFAPDPEWDRLEAAMARRRPRPPEED